MPSTAATARPELAEGGSHLATDEAEADHHGAPRATGGGADAIAVLHGAELEDPLEIGARYGERAVPPAGGDQKPVVGDALSVVQLHHLQPGVDGGDPNPQPELDVVLGVEADGVHELILESDLATEVGLREGGRLYGG